MQRLGIEEEELQAKGAMHTSREIAQQPELWSAVYDQIQAKKKQIKEFLEMALKDSDKIVLTGAGTSSFIGMSLEGSFFKHLGKAVTNVPSTDLVTHPYSHLSENEHLVMVSFARSGESPESLAVVNFADSICKRVWHVIITCNEAGSLAEFETNQEKLVIALPPESNDKSLAMTSSYTGMLLAGLLVTRINELDELKDQVGLLVYYGQKILEEYSSKIKMFAEENFRRAVFLGSGPLYGTACEGHLKLQEMTDGEIICKKDSYLGFRHGPKAVIDQDTALIYIFSNNGFVRKYEDDLVKSITDDRLEFRKSIGILERNGHRDDFDLSVVLSAEESHKKQLNEEFLPVCSILPLQLLAFYRSLTLGYQPDNPSVSGSISRVVEGVTIYPLEKNTMKENL